MDRKIILAPDYLTSESQQKRITGTVTDESGLPLPGVTVLLKGTTQGTVTNTDGNYFLTNITEDATLVFTFVGMLSQEIAVGNQTSINVSLETDAIGIEEVIAIGYGTQKKVNVIGSIVTVKNAEIVAAPVAMVANSLAGRLPGVIVQQMNGEPGADMASMLIRGRATLGDNSPLVVIDGIPGRDMNLLLAEDIESISVLKDASAGIYGARAANGVILITTKRGSTSAPRFSYSFQEGLMTPTFLAKMADAPTYATMIREMQSYRDVPEGDMLYSLDDIAKFESGEYPWTHPNTDWAKEVLATYSSRRNHNISVSGGTKNLTYYSSFGYNYEEGIYKNNASSYKRYNVSTNIDYKINEYFNVGIDLNGSQVNKNSPVFGPSNIWGSMRDFRPTMLAYYPNGLPGPDMNSGFQPAVISGPAPGFKHNNSYKLNTLFTATLKIPGVKGLALTSSFAYDQGFGVSKSWSHSFTLYNLDKQTYLDAGNTGKEDGSAFLLPGLRGNLDPHLSEYTSNSVSRFFNIKLSYDKTIAENHNIGAFIAMEGSDYLSQNLSASRRYFDTELMPYMFAGSSMDWSNAGGASNDARQNYFGRLTYNYKETYLLEFSLRRDGSIRFSEDNGRWGTFPSILAGWRVSNENFWKNNVQFIDYLKLKASFGQMGNDAVAAYQYLINYGFTRGSVMGYPREYVTGLAQSNVPNPLITWEVANVANVGFESTLLNNKLSFNADFFYQKRSDILVKRNASVPSFVGLSLPDENYGIVDNRGFEIELGYNERKGDISYGLNGNIAYAHNTVIEFDEPEALEPWQSLTGHPQGAMLLYKSLGIFRDQAQVDATPHVIGARPGDIIIEDYNKDGEITNSDKIIFDKNYVPELTFGLGFNLAYKNLMLSGLIQGTGTTLKQFRRDGGGSISNYYAYDAEDRWTVDNIDATKPRAWERTEEYWRTDDLDYNYQKGAYARMKNLQISYSLPQSLTKSLLLKNAMVYLSAQNLFFIFNNNKLQDPETGYPLGSDSNYGSYETGETYPIMKVYAGGVKIDF
ncbi:MAG: TonB-dependent receptor [Bacteroidetes bacterium]|nr:TonB-dependent receptor [Bacteroidota bacterium]